MHTVYEHLVARALNPDYAGVLVLAADVPVRTDSPHRWLRDGITPRALATLWIPRRGVPAETHYESVVTDLYLYNPFLVRMTYVTRTHPVGLTTHPVGLTPLPICNAKHVCSYDAEAVDARGKIAPLLRIGEALLRHPTYDARTMIRVVAAGGHYRYTEIQVRDSLWLRELERMDEHKDTDYTLLIDLEVQRRNGRHA